jgi:hypothetical protein
MGRKHPLSPDTHTPCPSLPGRTAFREVVFTGTKDRVTQAIIDLINKERDGGAVDRALLRKCVEIYEAMGEGTLEVYTEAFQVTGSLSLLRSGPPSAPCA